MGIIASALGVVRNECVHSSAPPSPQRVLNIRQLHARLHMASLQACPRTGLGDTGPPCPHCPPAPQRCPLPGVPSPNSLLFPQPNTATCCKLRHWPCPHNPVVISAWLSRLLSNPTLETAQAPPGLCTPFPPPSRPSSRATPP